MNKKLIIIFLLISLSNFVNAQDSIRYKHSGLFQQEYDFYLRSAITQPLLPLKQYAITAASYTDTKGDFMAKQDAPKQNEISFLTEGTRKIKKYLVSGSFSYSRIMKDSVSHTLGNNEQAAPYYFYAGSKGNWELSRYNLQGIISTPFLGDKITASFAGAYHVGNAWRSNDPRMENFSHNMEIEGAIHYNINARHTLGTSVGISSISEENSSEYRNKDYQDNLLNMPYINVINYGYGLSVIQTTNRQINSYAKGESVNGVYRGIFDFGTIALTTGYNSIHSRFVRKATESATANYFYGKFYEEILTSDIMWTSPKKGTQTWSFRASYKDHYGTDFNTILNGNNFVYYNTQFSIKPIFGHLKNNQLQYEIGLNGALSRLYKADGSTDHIADYRNADMGILASYYFSGKNADNFLKISAGANWRKNLDAKVSAPGSQVNTFTKEVVYYDYYFNGANSTSYTFSALYNFSVKNLPFFIKSTYQIQNAKLPEITLPAAAFPGTERHSGSFALGFTL
jgi:hypothetical protein